jgi:hypothetical protein
MTTMGVTSFTENLCVSFQFLSYHTQNRDSVLLNKKVRLLHSTASHQQAATNNSMIITSFLERCNENKQLIALQNHRSL